MPVFEGLLALPRTNEIVLDLLFIMATWHTYAKLRLHTTGSLEAFKATRQELGQALRLFNSDVCGLYTTRELPRETAARERREARAVQKAIEQGRPPPAKSTDSTQKAVAFPMNTFKLHGTTHLPEDICVYGTSDNYSTQTVSSLGFNIMFPYLMSCANRASWSTVQLSASMPVQTSRTRLWVRSLSIRIELPTYVRSVHELMPLCRLTPILI
jgi:hypothetical protein